jgi:hypothetical protein
VKYTVPPETFEPLGAVGDVNPGPEVGTPVGEDAEEELLLLLLLEEPHAAINATSSAAPSTPANLRRILEDPDDTSCISPALPVVDAWS